MSTKRPTTCCNNVPFPGQFWSVKFLRENLKSHFARIIYLCTHLFIYLEI